MLKARLHNALMHLAVPSRLKLTRQIESEYAWTIEQIQAYQEAKLRELIHYCWQYVPHYREKWSAHIAAPDEILTLKDLQKLPTLTKAEVRDHLPELTTTDSKIKSSEARTGGSTGKPTIFRMTDFDEQISWACMYAGWKRTGWRPGEPFLVVGGESIGAGLSDKRNWKDWLVQRWVSSGSNLTLGRAKNLAESEHFQHIRLIYGYPNSIRELGELLLDLNRRPPQLKGIVCTAEVMRPEIRERIKIAFGGVPVLDQWGMNDGGVQGCEGIEEEGMHIFPQRAILEILDEDDRQIDTFGQSGRAIATCLTNFATPFVRYESGDMVHWKTQEPASSGIAWPRIGPVDGRTGDVIYLANGRSIPMPGLTLVMRWLDGLHQYQFIQTGPNAVTVRLDRGPDFNLSEGDVLAFLKEKIAQEADWVVIWGPPELTKNGKLLIIRNDWLREQGLSRPPRPGS